MKATLAFVVGALALLFQLTSSMAQNEIRILVPTFDGPSNLAMNVSTILNLQLWTTLRRYPTPNPRKLDFGSGGIEWSTSSLGEPSHEFALAAARGTKTQMVLWGVVQQYGPGVIVQAFLTIHPNLPSRSSARWVVSSGDTRIELGLSSAEYEFSPLILSNDVVLKYSRPDHIRMCKTKESDCGGQTLSKTIFRGIRQEGEFAFVENEDKARGWVFLPNLSNAKGEMLDFVGGMIAYFRGDFDQAGRLFHRVANAGAGALMRFEALVLSGIAKARLNGSDFESLRRAVEVNPYSRYAAQALTMAYLSSVIRKSTAAEERSNLQSASSLVRSYRHLFQPDDSWLVGVDKLIHQLEQTK